MNEFDPDAHLILNMADDTEIRMDRGNSALFTFVGKTALGGDNCLRNHVFVRIEQEETTYGTYIFARNPVFNEIVSYMLQNDFPAHLNMLEVAECDERAYQLMLDQEMKGETIEDFLPDDWTDI